MKSPLVSVLMPAYNTEKFIAESITSILEQTYSNFELHISDDASTDNTFEIAQKFANIDNRIILHRQSKNIGFVKNKNFLFERIKGDFIAFQDSDDVSFVERLEKQVRVLLEKKVDLVGTNYNRLIQINNAWFKADKQNSINGNDIDQTFYTPSLSYPFWYPSLMFKKQVLNKVGKFNLYFNHLLGEDLYWTFVANENFPIYYLSEILYSYRDNPSSTTNLLSNVRKMIIPQILHELLLQRKENKTDFLELGDFEKIKALEGELLINKKFMAEQYRIWSAKAIDRKDKIQAKELLFKAFQLYPWRSINFSTLFYYLRS